MDEKNSSIARQDSLIIIAMITVIVLFFALSTYAISTWSGKDPTGGIETTISNIAKIHFDDSNTFNDLELLPVKSYTDGKEITFDITLLKNIVPSMYLNVSLENYDENADYSSIKYEIEQSDDNTVFNTISSGNFSNIIADSVNLLEDYKVESVKTYYKLYIYMDGNEDNSNLINKTFDLSINIDMKEGNDSE